MVLKYAKNIIQEEAAALKKLSESINFKFIETVKILSRTKGNIIITGVGKSGFIAKKIASTMTSTGTPAIFIHPTEASHGDLGLIKKNDSLIILSKSGKSKELFALSDFAKVKKVPIIFITCNEKCKLAENSTCNLILPNAMLHVLNLFNSNYYDLNWINLTHSILILNNKSNVT